MLRHVTLVALTLITPTGKIDVNTTPLGSRHDDHIAMLGQDLQSRLGEMRTFMVGCGALGCEFLKNFALIGLACGESGEVVSAAVRISSSC